MTKTDEMLDELDWIVFGVKWFRVNTETVLNACQRGLLDLEMSWNVKIRRD